MCKNILNYKFRGKTKDKFSTKFQILPKDSGIKTVWHLEMDKQVEDNK